MKCIYEGCNSEKIHAHGKCLRCYQRDWAREHRKKKTKPKLPKPPCKCGSPKIFCKSMCKACYDHNWRLTHYEQALENDKRHRERAKASGYTYAYNHRPKVIEQRRIRNSRYRKTEKYQNRMVPYLHDYNQKRKHIPRYIDIKNKAAKKYNRSDKARSVQARYRSKPGRLEARKIARRIWGVKTEYGDKNRERLRQQKRDSRFSQTLAGRIAFRRKILDVLSGGDDCESHPNDK